MNNRTAPIFGISRHRIPIDGKGVTTLVTLSHCPLQCRYCLNSQCEDDRLARRMTAMELLQEVRIDNLYFLATGGGVTFGGGEPAQYSAFIAEFKQLAMSDEDSKQWRITIETSLSVDLQHIERLAPFVDQWIIDVKDMHPDIYQSYTSRPISPLMQNLQWLASQGRQERCLMRIPFIPGYNTHAHQIESQQMLEAFGYKDFELFNYVLRRT